MGEHLPYKQGVACSSQAPPTQKGPAIRAFSGVSGGGDPAGDGLVGTELEHADKRMSAGARTSTRMSYSARFWRSTDDGSSAQLGGSPLAPVRPGRLRSPPMGRSSGRSSLRVPESNPWRQTYGVVPSQPAGSSRQSLRATSETVRPQFSRSSEGRVSGAGAEVVAGMHTI